MKNVPRAMTILLFFFVFTGPQASRAADWQIDPAHSGIYFDIRHIFATVRGQFSDFSGTVVFDPQDLAKSRFEIVVQTKSIDTHEPKRDNHLRSPDFFGVTGFATMTFKSSAIEHLQGDQYRVTGDLTIKDVTQRITVPFVFHGIKDNPLQRGKEVAGFDAHFSIEPIAYHVGDPKFVEMGAIGKDANILISLEVLREK